MFDRLFGHLAQARKHADPLQRFLGTFSQKYLGVFIGVFKGKQLWANTSPNTLLIGDKGKTLRSILPTIYFHKGPMVIHDPKGEIWYATADYRENPVHAVHRLDLSFKEGCDARYNPLDEVRLGTIHEVSDAAMLASLLADPDGKSLSDSARFWIVEAQRFLTALILHVLYTGQDKTLAGVDAFLDNPKCSVVDVCNSILSTVHDPTGNRGWLSNGEPTRTSPVVAAAASRLLGMPESDYGNIYSHVKSLLSIYRDPKVASLTSRSDFSLRDIMFSPNPQTVYVVISAEDTAPLAPLTQLIFGLVMAIEDTPAKGGAALTDSSALVLMQDVGLRLSRLADFLSAGYQRKLILSTDSLSSLFEVTKKSDAILQNFPVTIFFKTRDTKTASYAAKLNPELLRGDKLMRIDDSEAVVFTSNAPSLVVTFPRLANGAWWIGHDDEPMCSDTSPTVPSAGVAGVDSTSSPYLIDAVDAKDVQFMTPYGKICLTDYWPAGKHSDLYHAAFGGVLTIHGTRYAVGLGCYRKRAGETWSVIDYRNAPIPSPYQMFICPADQDAIPCSVKPTEKIEFASNLIGEAFVTANRELRDALLVPDGLEWHRLDYERFTRKAQGNVTAPSAVND